MIRLLTMLCTITYHSQVDKLKATSAKKFKYISNIFKFLRGGPRGRVIPSSFPNLEVKPPIADNTYPVWVGNVGRCLFDLYPYLSLSFLSSTFYFISDFINHYYKYDTMSSIKILGIYSVKKNCICKNFRKKF